MKRTSIVMIACLGIAAVGCGSDSGSGLSDAQAAAAEDAIDSAAEGGLTLDEECVNDLAAQLSDEDAEMIASGESDDVSDEAAALSVELVSCADEEELTDLFIEGMASSGDEFDEDCVRDVLADFDVAEITIATEDGDMPTDLIGELAPCLDLAAG